MTEMYLVTQSPKGEFRTWLGSTEFHVTYAEDMLEHGIKFELSCIKNDKGHNEFELRQLSFIDNKVEELYLNALNSMREMSMVDLDPSKELNNDMDSGQGDSSL